MDIDLLYWVGFLMVVGPVAVLAWRL